ncbi:MAG: hypothetical protein M1834_008446 [Cirrosporium novae-zelandiae]|nr:MAG: hypothetical protein M1834_008446 [Cirrosporium novae-zelandiae]
MVPMISRRDAVDDGSPNPRGTALVITVIIFSIISTFLAVARLITRFTIHRPAGPDDWTILFALVMAIALAFIDGMAVQNGFGMHKSTLNEQHVVTGFKYFYAAQMLYKSATCATKASILFLYRRIFRTDRTFLILVWVVMFIVVGYGFGTIMATIFQCTPIEKAWAKDTPGYCINVNANWYAASSLALITDAIIMILPLHQIYGLNLPKKQKFGLMGVMGVGIFVIIITTIRIILLTPATHSPDQQYYQGLSLALAYVEVSAGIICACMPTLKDPIQRVFPRIFSRTGSQPYSTSNLRSGTYINDFSTNHSKSANRGKTNTTISRRVISPTDSQEEIMLDSIGITKTTTMAVTFDKGIASDKGSTNASSVGGHSYIHDPALKIFFFLSVFLTNVQYMTNITAWAHHSTDKTVKQQRTSHNPPEPGQAIREPHYQAHFIYCRFHDFRHYDTDIFPPKLPKTTTTCGRQNKKPNWGLNILKYLLTPSFNAMRISSPPLFKE